MRIRAALLALLMASGFYMMLQEADEAAVHWLQPEAAPYSSIIFRQPGINNQPPITWKVSEEAEIDRLLEFLQAYDYERVDPDTLELFDDETYFSIDLLDASGSRMTILVEEGILIQDDRLYYEVVNGPLQVDWLLEFIFSNK